MPIKSCAVVQAYQLVSWSLTSLFSTNMAISETIKHITSMPCWARVLPSVLWLCWLGGRKGIWSVLYGEVLAWLCWKKAVKRT